MLQANHTSLSETPVGSSTSTFGASTPEEKLSIKSPFNFSHRTDPNGKPYEFSSSDSDTSFVIVSSGRQSVDSFESGSSTPPGRPSGFSDFGESSLGSGSLTPPDSFVSIEPPSEEDEDEMIRLKQKLNQTIHMYSIACKDEILAKQKEKELHKWKREEQKRLEKSRIGEEVAEMKAIRESKNKNYKSHDRLSDIRYRKYTAEEIEVATNYFNPSLMIREGENGLVYKCSLDYTPVAVKVHRPDIGQGRLLFHQEVDVLRCLQHPHVVLLIGACPEYGCLVYEYMSNGSLEDRLFRRGNTPPLSWQLRFKISHEIGAALLFLHRTKPKPIVHHDLKPADILLDCNYVSKISYVGLASSTPETLCYIDPEYPQTNMHSVKSNTYSLGIIVLQLLTGSSPMGLIHYVERSIDDIDKFHEILDQSIQNWPIEDALSLAKLALKCAQLRRKDRPDLAEVVMLELDNLRALAEKNMPSYPKLPMLAPLHSLV